MYLVRGGTWSTGGGGEHLVPGGVPGPGGTWSGGSDPGGRGVVAWSRGCTWSRGVPGRGVSALGVSAPGGGGFVPGQRGVSAIGGCTWSQGVGVVHLVQGWGVYLVRGGVCSGGGQVLPPVNRITDTCKNITLPQLRCGR